MATPTEPVLLDTNVLVYAMNRDAQHHQDCRELLERALKGELRVLLTPQVLFEYFAVVTSPRQLTTPLGIAEASSDVERMRLALPMIHMTPATAGRAMSLARSLGRSGRQIFDLVLVATMFEHGVRTIVTYDEQFGSVPGVVALRPESTA